MIFRVDPEDKHHVNITGGPLVYKYRFQELYIHFGRDDSLGSEHQINGNTFPAEVKQKDTNIFNSFVFLTDGYIHFVYIECCMSAKKKRREEDIIL